MTGTHGALMFFALALLVTPVLGQTPEQPPAQAPSAPAAANPQPPSEEAVASSFEAAAPELFKKFVEDNWIAVRDAGNLGRLGEVLPSCVGTAAFYTFTACSGAEPTEYSIDVRKTDSILTPYLGVIRVPYKLSCRVRNVVPTGISWSEAKAKKMEPSCLNKPYEECVQVGKDAPKTLGSACTGGPGFAFPFADTLVVTYKWSHGKWEFQKKEAATPTPPKKE